MKGRGHRKDLIQVRQQKNRRRPMIPLNGEACTNLEDNAIRGDKEDVPTIYTLTAQSEIMNRSAVAPQEPSGAPESGPRRETSFDSTFSFIRCHSLGGGWKVRCRH